MKKMKENGKMHAIISVTGIQVDYGFLFKFD